MLHVGTFFQSEKALIYCHNSAAYNKETGNIDIDTKRLIPNVITNPNCILRTPVEGDKGIIAQLDLRNTDEARANSLWEIIEVTIDPSGCGDSHNISGKSSTWARYFAIAKRVNIDGSEHASAERLHFSTSGFNTVKDFVEVLPLRAD